MLIIMCIATFAGGADILCTTVDTAVDVGPNYRWSEDKESDIIKLVAAQDEYRNFSLALRSETLGATVKYSIGALRDNKGTVISAENIKLRQCDFSERRSFTGHFLQPVTDNSITITKGKTQWLWGTLHVPDDCKPGIYYSDIVFTTDSFKKIIKIKLFIHDIVLHDDKGSWGFFMPGQLADMKSPNYKAKSSHDLTSENIYDYFAFWRRYKLNSPFLYHIQPQFKLIDGEKVIAYFPVLRVFVDAMRKNKLDGELCIDLRSISWWSQAASDAVERLKKAGEPIPHELNVVHKNRAIKKYSDLSKQFYKQIVEQLIATAKKEQWPQIRLMVSEELAGEHIYRQIVFDAFYDTARKIAPELLIAVDNSIGFGRKNAVDNGERLKFPVRQYNSWTEEGIADAKRAGAEVRSYNYDHFRSSLGFEQQRLETTGHHGWADHWGIKWVYSRVSSDGKITSSVQYERLREGRYDYLYCNVLEYYVEQLKKTDKKQSQQMWNRFEDMIADMPVRRPAFFGWNYTHNNEYIENMRMFVIGMINEARTLLGEKYFMPTAATSNKPKITFCTPAFRQTETLSSRQLLLSAPYISGNIKIDGDLDENFWHKIKNSTGALQWTRKKEIDLKSIAGADEKIKQPEYAEVSTAYDADGLYFGIQCAGNAISRYRDHGRIHGNNSGGLWHDDCIEIMMTNPEKHETFHIMINSEGYRVILKGAKIIPFKDGKVTTCSVPEGYKQEVFIPWKLFGLVSPPEAGISWPINIGREYHTKDQITSWGRVYKDYAELNAWGKLKFTGMSGNLNINLNTFALYPGKNILSGIAKSTSGKVIEKLLFLDETGKKVTFNDYIKIDIPDGMKFIMNLNVPEIRTDAIYTLAFMDGVGELLDQVTIPVFAAQKRIEINNMAKLARSGSEISMEVTVRVGNDELQQHSIKGCFVSFDKSKKVELPEFPLTCSGKSILKINTSSLTPGSWTLQLWLTGFETDDNGSFGVVDIVADFM